MPGGTLADRIDAETFAPARAVEIACAILSALGEAHRLGILHRDVKPSNVLFDEVGAARLSDFGAAHLGDLSSTATAGAIGTFAYMSPEQRLGRPASIASDIYGVGALLGQLLTGEPPKPVTDRLDPLPSACHPDMNAAHDAVLARLLQEEPEKRPADAFEARRLLLGVSWPERVWARPARPARPVTERPSVPEAARLGPALSAGDGRDAATRQHDAWLDRDVLVLPDDPTTLERARAFARAGHPALPTVLRVDREMHAVWIAAPLGRALADEPVTVSPDQVARLREAIEALHAVSGAHGFIDPSHLYSFDGEVTLAFPRATASDGEPADAAARDLEALALLG
jgi:serine/threonine-protein kinase